MKKLLLDALLGITVLIGLLITCGALWLIIQAIKLASWVATLTPDRRLHKLLKRLRRTGCPTPNEDLYYDDYGNHRHVSSWEGCTPTNCEVAQARRYKILLAACQKAAVSPWRLRLINAY